MGKLTLYDILHVSKDDSEEEIRRSYKMMALKHHPDRSGGDAKVFEEISKAYKIITDPHLRKIYDQLGENGLKIVQYSGNNPIVVSLLSNVSKIYYFFFFVALIVMLLITQIVVIVTKIEKKTPKTWWVAFAPIWIIDLLFLILLYIFYKITQISKRYLQGEQLQHVKRMSMTILRYFCFRMFLYIVFQVLLAYNLENYTILWVLVFFPIIVSELLSLAMIIYGYSGDLQGHRAPGFRGAFLCVCRQYGWWFYRMLIIILIVLRLDVMTFSWLYIFGIMYSLYLLLIVTDLVEQKQQIMRMTQQEQKKAMEMVYKLNFYIYIVFSVLYYSILILLNIKIVLRSIPSMYIILIPIFIALLPILLVFGCFFPCVTCILLSDKDTIDNQSTTQFTWRSQPFNIKTLLDEMERNPQRQP